jgi:Bacterial PH domain
LAGRRVELDPGERLLVDLHPHWTFLTGPLAVAGVFVAIGVTLDVEFPHTSVALHWLEGLVVAVPCVWLVVRAVRWRTTSLVMTTQRLVEAWGVAHRQEWDVPLERIASVAIVQTLPRRLLGTGRLRLTLWEDNRSFWIDDVRKPAVLRRVIIRRMGTGPPPERAMGQSP